MPQPLSDEARAALLDAAEFADDMLELELLGMAVLVRAQEVVESGGILPASLGDRVYDDLTDPREPHGQQQLHPHNPQ